MSVPATTELTEDPNPIGSIGKKLRSPIAFGRNVTEDPGPINTFWKKLRADTPRPVLDIVEDPTPVNTIWKKLRSPGVFQNDAAAVVPFDVENVVFLFYFAYADTPQLRYVAAPADAALITGW